MKINESFEIQIKIIINNNLYQKKIISEETFNEVNNKLLRLLKDN